MSSCAPRVLTSAFILKGLRAIQATAREAWMRHRQRREAAATREALRVLDNLALRDLGIRRGEIDSVAAEAAAAAERTRRRLRLTDS